MTPESKIEIAERATEALGLGDLDALGQLLTPDCEIVPFRADVEQTVFRGPDALSTWFAAVDKAWESMTSETESIREGPDRVLGFVRLRARGRESGAEVDVPAGGVYRFRDCLITAIRVYTSRAEALADLGHFCSANGTPAAGMGQQMGQHEVGRAMSENLDLVRSIYAEGA